MISAFDYLTTLRPIQGQIAAAIDRVLQSGQLIHGPETASFETEFASWIGAGYSVGVTSGTAAIDVALRSLGVGPGDEVITVSNTCTPTVSAIRNTGAMPVFVDVDPTTLMMDVDKVDDAVTEQTRCILPVHLFGRAVDMVPLMHIANRHQVPVVEDCAQATGTKYRGSHVGTFGAMGCFSFYPTKNLGAYGDAGAVVTNDEDLADRARRIRMYGYSNDGIATIEGTNARISEIQAAILRTKLPKLDSWLATRRMLASAYDSLITAPGLTGPVDQEDVLPSHHLYVVRCRDRDAVAAKLRSEDIGFGIHYPTPVHLMPAYAFLGGESLQLPTTAAAADEVLSLPLHEALELRDVEFVANVLGK